MMIFKSLTMVAIGAVLGAWIRWGLSLLFNAYLQFLPLGTLLSNLIGGFLMGVAMAVMASATPMSNEVRLLVTTGFLGGLTTFSTFSAESFQLLSQANYSWAALHLSLHVLGSVLMTMLGFILFQQLKG